LILRSRRRFKIGATSSRSTTVVPMRTATTYMNPQIATTANATARARGEMTEDDQNRSPGPRKTASTMTSIKGMPAAMKCHLARTTERQSNRMTRSWSVTTVPRPKEASRRRWASSVFCGRSNLRNHAMVTRPEALSDSIQKATGATAAQATRAPRRASNSPITISRVSGRVRTLRRIARGRSQNEGLLRHLCRWVHLPGEREREALSNGDPHSQWRLESGLRSLHCGHVFIAGGSGVLSTACPRICSPHNLRSTPSADRRAGDASGSGSVRAQAVKRTNQQR
jgi:hypothetical protein